MNADEIERLVSVGRPSLHPEGARLVVAASHPDLGADRNVGQLWEFPVNGSPGRRLTRGDSDFAPRFSPDGRLLAFLRAGDGPAQLHVVDARGGEPRRITDQPLGVGGFAWSPDSRSIAFVARVPEPGRYGTVDGLEASAEPPRRITTRSYRADGLGWNLDRIAQLFVLEVPPPDAEPAYRRAPSATSTPEPDADSAGLPETRRLSHAPADLDDPVFTPDGAAVVVLGSLHESRDLDLRRDAWRFPIDGGEPALLTDGGIRAVDGVGFLDDGRLWFTAVELGDTGLDFVGRSAAVFVDDGDGVRRLTEPATLTLSGVVAPGPGNSLLVVRLDRGAGILSAVHDDGAVVDLIGPDAVVGGVDAAGGLVAVSLRTADSMGEVAVLDGSAIGSDLGDGSATVAGAPPRLRTLSRFGDSLRDAGTVQPHEETHPSRDGYPVHGWVAVPEGEGPHPVLLQVHGGPFAQYDVGVFDETQVLVDAGYAVVYANPRGSAGYGEQHARAIRRRMGTDDLDDVLGFLDGAIAAHPELDGDRVGILGGSYGGYLTAWTIAHDQRFRAAVVERGFLDPEAFVGTSDIGAFFSDEYTGTDPARRAAQSPQAFVDRVRTPTLVVHSENDLRCPLPQATRYHQSLLRNGVVTELLVFPGEGHELSRSGRPRHRVQRFEAILDWFDRHLPVRAS